MDDAEQNTMVLWTKHRCNDLEEELHGVGITYKIVCSVLKENSDDKNLV
jgi:hypothetical protein